MSGGSIIKPCESTVQVEKISSHRETWVPTVSVLKGKALYSKTLHRHHVYHLQQAISLPILTKCLRFLYLNILVSSTNYDLTKYKVGGTFLTREVFRQTTAVHGPNSGTRNCSSNIVIANMMTAN